MKSRYVFFMVIVGALLLVGCKPSDKYVGDWYALAGNGDEVMIDFSKDKTMTITGDDYEETHEINQNATGFQNSIRYFRIEIDGANHYVVFEQSKDEDNAKFIRQTNMANDFEDVVGDVIFLMNRNDFPSE